MHPRKILRSQHQSEMFILIGERMQREGRSKCARVMCSGRLKRSHCDCTLIVKSHSQQCSMQWTVPQSFFSRGAHTRADVWPTLHDSAKITPIGQVYIAYCRFVSFKPALSCTLHHSLSSACSPYSPPEEETKQRSVSSVSPHSHGVRIQISA